VSVEIQRVTFQEWNRGGPWRDELADAFERYLRKSGEEMTLAEQWQLVNLAMLGREDLLFLVATESDETLLGFAICRLLPGTLASGRIVQVWQVYVVPGRAKLAELFELAWPQIEAYAKANGAARCSMMTRRMTAAYDRLLRSLGFEPYALHYSRGVA